jgi:hypothetical protein
MPEDRLTEKQSFGSILALVVLFFATILAAIWLFSIPAPGYAIGLLGVVAVFMPLRGKMSRPEEAIWTAVVIILLIAEFRAIRHDRVEQDEKQAKILNEERDNFHMLLTQENNNLNQILAQESKNMQSVLDSEQRNFKDTLTQNRKAQSQERSDFAALLNRQQEVLTREEELYEFSAGKMLPANDPAPTICNPLRANDFLVTMGDATWATNTFPFTVLKMKGRNVIKLDKSESGAILITIDLRTKDGTTIARIDHNRAIINPSSGLVMWRDKNTLVLEDQHGNEVLNARYLNEKSFHISGSFLTGGPTTMFRGCFRVSGVGTGIDID